MTNTSNVDCAITKLALSDKIWSIGEKQTSGVKLGWTDDGEPATRRKVPPWFFITELVVAELNGR